MSNLSRRNWLAMAGAAGVAMAGRGAMGAVTQIHEGGGAGPNPFARNVLEFGARGDAKKDNTAAFQKAMDAVYAGGGGIVHVPPGRYLFKGHLTMPANTSLDGVFLAPPAYIHANPVSGTVLLTTEGRGRTDGPPFIGVHGNNCTIRGLGIFYPDQDSKAAEPAPYPWTIGPATAAQVADLSVMDVALTNPYQGINLEGAPRHYIVRVYGHPIKTGLIVDRVYDIGRIENIHFWPFWAKGGSPVCNWIQAHGTAFIFGRSDWQYVFNTFSWGYRIGYQFIQTAHGACNGNFLGIGADSTFEALRVDAAQPASGLLITNGEFVGMIGAESQGFVIGPKNTAQVIMNNCGFWGPSNRIGTIQGAGPVSLIGCNWQAWDKHGRGEPAIYCDGAPTTIMGCQFLAPDKKKAVGITKGCAGAVITGNTSMGNAFIVDRPGRLPRTRFQIHSNIACPSQWGNAF
ncbi:MAG: glycosyl hydrolase family 28-related protein [Phycisphaerae bacterium]